MPGHCEAVGCTNHTLMTNNKPSFHRFPKDKDLRAKWENALKKLNRDGTKWKSAANARLCGSHFINGKPSKDPDHPDYIPSLFEHVKKIPSKSSSKMRRFQSIAKRRVLKYESVVPPEQSSPQNIPTDTASPNIQQQHNESPSIAEPDPHLFTPHSEPISFTTPVSLTERGMIYNEMDSLRKELFSTQNRAVELERKLKTVSLSVESIKENDFQCMHHTGLKWAVFLETFKFLQPLVKPTQEKLLPLIDQFFLCLMKLRMNLTFEFLARHTALSKTGVVEIFTKWMDVMYLNLKFLIKHPDNEVSLSTLPPVFKELYPRLTSIVDCFEIFIDQPKNLKARAKTYSNYKKHNTVKVFIACTPLGSISFLSSAWGGRVSDVELIRKCGYISPDIHEHGDQILADRGFQVQEEFSVVCGAEFIIPAFTKGKTQLSAKEVEVSRKLASVRIHIERIIGVLKNRYKILQGPLPINLIKSIKDESCDMQVSKIDKIITVCACLVNLGEGIVSKVQ